MTLLEATELVGALTDREREILALIADGRSNADLAQHLYLSSKTIETHVRNIYAKLNLHPERGHRRVQAALIHLGARAHRAHRLAA